MTKKKMDPVERMNYENKVQSGAGWFTIIALLTLINTTIVLSGQDWGFAVGLGLTIFTDALGLMFSEQFGVVAKVGAFAISFVAAGTFFAIGRAAAKRKTGLYVVGTVLYGIDTLITLVTISPVPIAIHLFVMVNLIISINKCKKLNKVIAEEDAFEAKPDALSALFPHLDGAVSAPAEPQEEIPAPPPLSPPVVKASEVIDQEQELPVAPAAMYAPTAEIAAAMATIAQPPDAPGASPAAPPPQAAPAATESKLKVLYRN